MIRVRLLKSWKHPYKIQPFAVGTILQPTFELASELMADKIAVLYTGEYPPKSKIKIDLKQLNK